jgi:hypothetical protein
VKGIIEECIKMKRLNEKLVQDNASERSIEQRILALKPNHEEPIFKWIQILQIVKEPIVGT